jgi:hypothetical protein
MWIRFGDSVFLEKLLETRSRESNASLTIPGGFAFDLLIVGWSSGRSTAYRLANHLRSNSTTNRTTRVLCRLSGSIAFDNYNVDQQEKQFTKSLLHT